MSTPLYVIFTNIKLSFLCCFCCVLAQYWGGCCNLNLIFCGKSVAENWQNVCCFYWSTHWQSPAVHREGSFLICFWGNFAESCSWIITTTLHVLSGEMISWSVGNFLNYFPLKSLALSLCTFFKVAWLVGSVFFLRMGKLSAPLY